ncbi:glycosyltransferase family 4 protein [Bacillus sp. NTK074B]|uniref:glycosyltransferase family 4 protein n=1 Tax=Bacillus sp. NTK074B TaxID=2802174 RepID=UPI001A8F8B9B|nr:glycosyltransferase family 4 protein [Bacillus sp. NTK074B]
MKKVCVLTTVHPAYDGRIYHKEIKSLKKAGYHVTLIAPEPEDKNIAKEDGIELIPIFKPKSEISRILQSFKVVKAAMETKADIYHFHDPELLPAGVLIRLMTKRPVIFDVHEHYPNAIMSKKYLKNWLKRPISLLYRMIERVSLTVISGVIYTTEEIGERYKRYKSIKIENYPLKTMFNDLNERSPNEFELLYLGGITPIRGIEELIRGFAIVHQAIPEARLVFVGGFESHSFELKIKKIVEELDLENHIEFKGKFPYTQIAQFLSHSSLGVIPYLPVPNHLVCLPNKLFEYMAAGVPVIASDFPHYRKVVENAQVGILVDPEQPARIAEGILSLLTNQSSLGKYSINGKSSFDKTYNWEEEERKLVTFYRTFHK